ncbi:uncharacterized protein TNCT_444241 [Trichonephila clavata]|uniref:Uncharacterized protein n=1 Tax=Trichonephila clavata TaxID=2740835 RepID=A0A8X6L1P6_TRICU|nr:uncharacterized protein TNCT_444241 [Trichonephila clavata]
MNQDSSSHRKYGSIILLSVAVNMDAVLINAVIFCRRQWHKQKKNRLWIHKINRKRPEFGIFHHLHPNLRKDEKKFYSFFRMSEELFSILLDLVGQEISKWDTNYRKSITAEERLSICLR